MLAFAVHLLMQKPECTVVQGLVLPFQNLQKGLKNRDLSSAIEEVIDKAKSQLSAIAVARKVIENGNDMLSALQTNTSRV